MHESHSADVLALCDVQSRYSSLERGVDYETQEARRAVAMVTSFSLSGQFPCPTQTEPSPEKMLFVLTKHLQYSHQSEA